MTSIYDILINFRLILRNEKNIAKRLKLLSTYLRLFFKYIILIKFFKIKIEDENIFSYKIKFDTYASLLFLFEEIFIQKCYEFKTNKENPFIIDCGSNIGISLVYFKLNYPTSKIIAFEPNEITFQILKENIINNNFRNVEVINAAVYDKEGPITLYSSLAPGGAHTSTYKRKILGKMQESKCRSVLLSSYIEDCVDFLKIDIEGSESKVIEELSQKQKLKFIEEMVIEYHYLLTDDLYTLNSMNNKLQKILEILNKNNFEYVISSFKRPPFYIYRKKSYGLFIYAYKDVK